MLLKVPGEKSKGRSDEALLSEFRETGGLDTLGILYSRYMHLVYGVCIKYLKDRDAAKDEVISIFEKLAADTLNHEIVNFKTWLYVVTKNHCLMILRSKKSETERETIMINDPLYFMENNEELHPIDRDEGLNDERLSDCISRLKEEQRLCIRMFYYEDKCYREISESLKMDEKKVKSYLQNGKRNLKICLEGKYVAQEEK
jgi:RNA polymerase sigma-70 factor, ECF subfamily